MELKIKNKLEEIQNMKKTAFIIAILFAAVSQFVLNAADPPDKNLWCYNKLAAGYLEAKTNRSLFFNELKMSSVKGAMLTKVFPTYFSCGAWNLHTVPKKDDGHDHVPAGFNQFKSISYKNPAVGFVVENPNFVLTRKYSLLPDSSIFKLEFEWLSKRVNYVDTMAVFYSPAKKYQPKTELGNAMIYTDETGRTGFAVFADQSFYKEQKFGAVMRDKRVSLPGYTKIAIPKDAVIRLTVYIALFNDTDPAAALEQAKAKAFGKDTDRAVFNWKPASEISTSSLIKQDGKAAVWRLASESAVEKGFVPAGPAQPWKLSAAGNEFIADQLAITPAQELTQFKIKIGDFKGPDNAVLPGNIFRLEAVSAVPHLFPGNAEGTYGDTMDRLLTVLPEKLTTGINQVFLLSGRIPAGQKPGEYVSEIRIESKEYSASVPLTLKVRNFSLPEEPAFYCDFLISGGNWANKFSKTPKEDAKYIKEDLLPLRIHPAYSINVYTTKAGKLGNDPGKDILKKFAADGKQRFRINGAYRCNRFSKLKPCSPEMDKAMTDFAVASQQALEKYNLTDRSLWQLGDECHVPKYLKMQIHYSKLTGKVAPKLRRFATINGFNPLVEELIRHTDIIVPQSEIYFNKIKDQMDLTGKEIWTYDNSFVTVGIRPAVIRGIAWRSFRFGFTGYHQWSVNAWSKNWKPGVDNSGCIYYAPLDAEVKPQRSLRLVNFALGISDYDYLTLLRDEIRSCKDRKAAAAAEKELQEIVTDMIPDSWSQPAAYRKMESGRIRLGDLIEKLKAESGK